eukprot:8006715-Pyramimonas_sp.AAC.1
MIVGVGRFGDVLGEVLEIADLVSHDPGWARPPLQNVWAFDWARLGAAEARESRWGIGPGGGAPFVGLRAVLDRRSPCGPTRSGLLLVVQSTGPWPTAGRYGTRVIPDAVLHRLAEGYLAQVAVGQQGPLRGQEPHFVPSS